MIRLNVPRWFPRRRSADERLADAAAYAIGRMRALAAGHGTHEDLTDTADRLYEALQRWEETHEPE